MNKKYLIVALAVIIIAIIGCVAFLGNTTNNDPHTITVTAPNHLEEPAAGFNPLTGWGCGHMNTNPLVQSTLFTTDSEGNFTGDLATSYDVSSDGKTWTVNIRDDVKFSNNESLKASDVAFTFNEAARSKISSLDMTNLKNATAVNDTTVEFTLNEPQSTFIYKLRYVGIVPEKDYNNETYGSNPIGSGPYMLKQWDKGQQAIFVANPNYYGEKPYFTQVNMVFPDESGCVQLAKSGQADFVYVPLSQVNDEVDGYDKIDISAGRAQGIALPYLNDSGEINGVKVGNDVTADPAIRHALNVGINRQDIADTVYHGHGSPEYTGADSRPYGNPDAKVQDNDIEGAKKILKEGGWVDTNGDGIVEKDGVSASFKLFYPPEDEARQAYSTVVAEHAKKLGINITLESADWDTIYENMYSSATAMQMTSNDPFQAVYKEYHTKNISADDYLNPNAYSNPNVDQVLQKALSASSQDEAQQYWKEAALLGDGGGYSPAGDAPWLWLVNYYFTYFIKSDIDMGDVPPNQGQDPFINIVEWKRVNGTVERPNMVVNSNSII